jgi:hypothetical protein
MSDDPVIGSLSMGEFCGIVVSSWSSVGEGSPIAMKFGIEDDRVVAVDDSWTALEAGVFGIHA